MTSDLQQTRYDKLVRRVGGIIGPGSKVAEALPELFPVVDVESQLAELLLLGGTRTGFGGGTQAPVVGQAGRAQLFNPVDSNVLVTVTRVFAASGSINVIRWGLRSTAIATAIDTQLLRDTREILPAAPTAVVRSDTSATLANATGQQPVIANAPFYLTDPNGVAVLAPGQGFEIGNGNSNTSFFFTFYWREREAIQSELSLPG